MAQNTSKLDLPNNLGFEDENGKTLTNREVAKIFSIEDLKNQGIDHEKIEEFKKISKLEPQIKQVGEQKEREKKVIIKETSDENQTIKEGLDNSGKVWTNISHLETTEGVVTNSGQTTGESVENTTSVENTQNVSESTENSTNTDVITFHGQKIDISQIDDSLITQMKKFGIVIEGKAIIETTEAKEKIKKYISILNFISDVERDDNQKIKNKKELVDNYIWLLEEGSDYIKNKEYITIKYLEAINNDINREGAIIEKDDNGLFRIKKLNPSANVGDYEKIFNTKNQTNFIETAMVTSIMRKDLLDENKNITKESFYSKIFQEYEIKAAYIVNGKVVRKENEIAKISQIGKKLVKDDYVKQIEDKIKEISNTKGLEGNPDLLNKIQELKLAKEYLSKEQKGTNHFTSILKEVNSYKNEFLEEKKLVNAMSEYGGSFGEIAKNVLKEKKGAILLLGIIAWMMGHKKTAFSLMGVGLFGEEIGDMVKAGQKMVETTVTDEELNIDFADGVKEIFDNEDHQSKYNELYEFNKINQEKGGGKENPSMDEKKLTYITKQISKNQINIDISGDVGDDTAKKILSGMDIYSYNKGNNKIELQDIKNYIKILKASGIEDTGDKTTLDYLTNGQDILNEKYDYSKSFTGIEAIDKDIKNILKKEWDTIDSNPKKEREKREKIQKIFSVIPTELSTFLVYAGNTWKFLKNTAKSVVGGTQETYNSSKVSVLVDNTINSIKNIDNNLAKEISLALKNYEKFAKAVDELSGFEGYYDENISDIKAFLKDKFNIGSVIVQYNNVNNKIEKLEKIIIKDPLGKKEPFLDVNKKIRTLIDNLRKTKKELLKQAGDKGINVNDSGIQEVGKVYESGSDKVELLADDIESRLKDIKKSIKSIEKDKSIRNIDGELEDIKKEIEILNRYEIELKGHTSFSDKEVVKIFQEKIFKFLKEFDDEKIKLKELIVKGLNKVYEKNEEQKDNLDKIDVSDVKKIEETIKGLSKVYNYLENLDLKKEEFLKIGVNEYSLSISYGSDADEIKEKFEKIQKNAKEFFPDIDKSIKNKTTIKELREKYEEKYDELLKTVKKNLDGYDSALEQINDPNLLEGFVKELSILSRVFEVKDTQNEKAKEINSKMTKLIQEAFEKVKKRYLEIFYESNVSEHKNILASFSKDKTRIKKFLDDNKQNSNFLKNIYSQMEILRKELNNLTVKDFFEKLNKIVPEQGYAAETFNSKLYILNKIDNYKLN